MKTYIKASVVSLALLVSGVLVSPSAQVQIQRGYNTVGSFIDIIGASATYKWVVSGTSLLLQSSTGGAFSTVGTFTSGGNFSAAGFLLAGGTADVYTTSGEFQGNAGTGQRLDLNTNGRARFMNSDGSNTYDITLADWGTTLSAEGVPVADTVVLAGPASGVGTLTLSIGTDNNVCVFVLTGTAAPVELHDSGTLCSVTAGTASSVNVYYSAGYQIQNLRGGAREIRAVFAGG